jgi:tetratricopeptide (TPR) repeat protein
MPPLLDDDMTFGRRYALCVGIKIYTNMLNRDLRYAVTDATTIAERLGDPQRGNFTTRVLKEPAETTKGALDEAVEQLLSAPDRRPDDLALLYFSCHGDVDSSDNTFYLLPSNATQQANGTFKPTTVITLSDLARWFSRAKTQNIVLFLDVCHSGGAGAALQHFKLNLDAGPNFFILGAARQDQVTSQISSLHHGMFTHCLLRAFEQAPTRDGWLTISQIQNFVSSDISWFAKDQPVQLQAWSVFVDPHLPLLRNPGYPELCPLPPLWNVPLQRSLFFVEQDDVLSQLASILHSEKKTALTQPYALNGLGGIGKTQLALEYAYRHRQDYHAILWGRAETREALVSTFVNIASLLDLPQKDEKDLMVIVEAVKVWLMHRAQWLFILDNADELALVREFIPPAFRGDLLLTTRAQSMGGLAHKLEIKVMQPEIGALLLLRRSGLITLEASLETASPKDVELAKVISKELGGLPLAIDQAGAYIEEAQYDLSAYQHLYRTHRAELLRERGGLGGDHPEPVATTWSLSFQKIKQQSLAAADLLQFCAYLAPDAIPEEIITRGAAHLGSSLQLLTDDPFTLNQALTVLSAYSLIRRDMQEKTLNMHRLVQTVLRDSLPIEIQHQWMQRAVSAVEIVYPDPGFANWTTFERLLPQALTCAIWIEQAPLSTLSAAHLLNKTGLYLNDRGQYREAEPLFERALAIKEQQLDANHPSTATSLNNLAGLYANLGKYVEAEPLLVRALAIKEHRLGANHPSTATSLNNLAGLYQFQGKDVEAEPLCVRARAINEQQLGANHPDTATSLNNLAVLYVNLGRYVEAEPLCVQALAINEHQLGANHPDTATSLNNLADLYRFQGKDVEAEPLYVRTLAIREQQLGANHPDTATSLNNLAGLYQFQGRYVEAEPLCVRALAIREQQLGANHPKIVTSLNNLADLYRFQGKDVEAEPLYVRTLAIREQQLGANHLDIATSLNKLAVLYVNLGRYVEAEPLCVRALAIREQQLGANHPDIVTSLNNLTLLYNKQGKDVEAEPLYVRTLAIREQQLGANHPDIATSLNKLAVLYVNLGRYVEAEPLCVRALAIREQQLGANHPDIVTSLNNLTLL